MKERIKSIDSLRGLAILAVILIHTTTRTLEASSFNLVGFSWTLFLNQVMRFAVPLFIMISGFVLEKSSREESYWSFIRRRFSKIFVPYFIWSLFYYFLVYNNNHDNLIKVFLTGNASYQLYFIPALLVFYLTFPLLHKLVHKVPSKIIFTVVSILGLVLLTKNYYFKAFDLGDEINAMILSYAYFIIGILSAKNKEFLDTVVNKFKIFLSIPTVLLAFFIFLEGKSRYFLTGNYLSYYSQWRPSVFFYSILVGLTFYYIFEHTKFKDSFVSRFSKHSFFAFFVHVVVLEVVWKFVGDKYFYVTNVIDGKIIFDPIFFGVVAFSSFLISKLVHKIPKSNILFG